VMAAAIRRVLGQTIMRDEKRNLILHAHA